MIIKQLSIYLSNSVGRLTEVTRILADNGINLRAFTLSENSDFGILRLITDDTEKALDVLKANNLAVSVTDVVCIALQDVPGSLNKCIEKLSDAGVSVEYMYAFAKDSISIAVIRTTDVVKCDEIVGRTICD